MEFQKKTITIKNNDNEPLLPSVDSNSEDGMDATNKQWAEKLLDFFSEAVEVRLVRMNYKTGEHTELHTYKRPAPTEAQNEDKIYPDFASAQEALDRGESVRIAMEPFEIDPQLIQKALDLQSQDRLDEWKRTQS